MGNESWITRKLASANPLFFSSYCIVAAFGTYFCMYAFRKPFTAATFDGMAFQGIDFKLVLVAAQVAGYTLSKFIGIKVISELPSKYRAIGILSLIVIAEVALFLFAVTPVPWNFIWLFVNGLPLGMVFGLVLGFLEGRRLTEALSAGLCASFIMSSGFVKSVGRSLIVDFEVGEFWMPVLTGLIFIVPLVCFVGMLSQIPPPTVEDEQLRNRRTTMNARERRSFFRRHSFGLIGLIAIYVLLTVVRSLRDDFAVEIWRDMGVDDQPSVFARSEFCVMIGVVVVNALSVLTRNNRLALIGSLGMMSVAFILVLGASWGYKNELLSPFGFMILLGLGLYVPYVAFHTTIFERMLAAFRETGTIGYLMYLADAVGYLGYVGVMFYRNSSQREGGFLELMIWSSVLIAFVSTCLSVILLFHFYRSTRLPLDPNQSLAKS